MYKQKEQIKNFGKMNKINSESVFEYLKKQKDEVLTPSNFCEADLVLFGLITLIDISKVNVPFENEDRYITLNNLMANQVRLHKKRKLGLILNKEISNYLIECSKTNRYKDIKFYNLYHKVDSETQSTFVMCDLSNDISIVIFGGTDDSVTGWKENFKLLVNSNPECLNNAKEYVNRNCTNKDKKYVFIGHSKGGMLCCYSFFECDKSIQEKVIVAYDLDGTGFTKQFVNKHKDDVGINKFQLICPKGSVVGRLFYQVKRAIVVKSSYHSLNEHNPVSWMIINDGSFQRCKSFSKKSSINEVMIKKYLEKLSKNETENLYKALAKIINAGNAKTLTMLMRKPIRIFIAITKLPKAEKKVVLTIPVNLLKNSIQTNKEKRTDKKR